MLYVQEFCVHGVIRSLGKPGKAEYKAQEIYLPNVRARMSAMFETEGHSCDGVRDRFGRELYGRIGILYADVAFLFCFFFEKGYTPFHAVITA